MCLEYLFHHLILSHIPKLLPLGSYLVNILNSKGQGTSKRPRTGDSEKRARLNFPIELPVCLLCPEGPLLWCIELSDPAAVSYSQQSGSRDICPWRTDRPRRKRKGFAKSYVQNRDFSQGKQETSHSSWTYHCCSFLGALMTCLVNSVSDQLMTLRQGTGPGFLSFGTVYIGGWVILHPGHSPVHNRICNSISGFYPLDACSTHAPSWNNQECSVPLPYVPLATKSYLVENQ